MPNVAMPDGTVVAMPDKLDAGTAARLRAFQAQGPKTAPVEQTAEATPIRDAASWLENRVAGGVANLTQLPVDIAYDIGDLFTAGVGTVGHEVFGTKLPELPFGDRASMPGSSQNLQRALGVKPMSAAASPGERIAGAAIEAAPFGALGEAQSIPQVLRSMGASAAQGGVGQGAGELGLPPAGQIAASTLVPGAGAGTQAAVEAAKRKVVGSTNIPAEQARFKAAGMERPSAGMVTGSKPLQTAEALSAATLGGTDVFAGEAAARARGLQGRVGKLVESMAPGGASPTAAGTAVERGLEQFKTRFGGKQDQLEVKASSFMGPNDLVPVGKTRALLTQGARAKPGEERLTTATGSARLREWHQALEEDIAGSGKDQITYETMRAWRTNIGRAIKNPGMFPDVGKEDLKALYGALSSDMTDAFAAKGGDAAKAWQRAQTHYRVGQDRIREVLSKVGEKGSPEEIFKATTAGTREGGTRLNRLLNSLPAADRGVVSGAFVERLGKVTPDAEFSLDRFVTQWTNLAPEAKTALLKGPARADMDLIAQQAGKVKEAGKMYFNPPGTAKLQVQAGEAGGILTALLLGHPGTAAAGVGAAGLNRYFAKAVHDPAFIGWLAQSSKVPPGEIAQQAARLYAVAKQSSQREGVDPEIAESEAAIALSLGAKGQ